MDLDRIPNEKLRELLQYWRKQRGDRPLPRRADIDPTEIRSNVGRLHLLAVEGAGVYRYKIYGSEVTNPDRLEMTERTTRDYIDQGFAALVTAHMTEAVDLASPTCYRIEAVTDGKPYCYIRLILPLGAEDRPTHLLVGTQRIEVDPSMHRKTVSGL